MHEAAEHRQKTHRSVRQIDGNELQLMEPTRRPASCIDQVRDATTGLANSLCTHQCVAVRFYRHPWRAIRLADGRGERTPAMSLTPRKPPLRARGHAPMLGQLNGRPWSRQLRALDRGGGGSGDDVQPTRRGCAGDGTSRPSTRMMTHVSGSAATPGATQTTLAELQPVASML